MTLIMENQTRLESWNNYCDDFVNHLRNSKAVLALLGAVPAYPHIKAVYEISPRKVGSREIRCWFGNAIAIDKLRYYRRTFRSCRIGDDEAGFLTITQNVDDLSQRARHPPELLVPIHGSLLDLHCTNTSCNYFHHHNSHDPHLHPQPSPPTPSCPLCTSLLRPSITRFGDPLPPSHLSTIESWFFAHPTIDLMLVIGCACTVSPAADYIDKAKEKGARIAVFNVEFGRQALCLGKEDWFFEGDAGVMVPLLLGKVVG
ncbi:DHS-like NAD/FAD-binding domain-containing protein [Aureobasidium pullulans]|uniref:DHS-like NAD/FAD-binding domain-containing protein n=1 Tax=Aureobasidium pullulans TaxID=5580 RepID=A0A4S8YAA0_AURPU|nr:DHS-like NAD/FAD-binding domain-containing protein [Aureobasidium pullulans]